MRLWSLHPKYLDPAGLVALWRESLLARKVLEGNTSGYRSHPQLERFRAADSPLDAMEYYLSVIYEESLKRDYHFSVEKIERLPSPPPLLTVTSGQLEYEFRHLTEKIRRRNPALLTKLQLTSPIEPHPSFRIEEGDICLWERIK